MNYFKLNEEIKKIMDNIKKETNTELYGSHIKKAIKMVLKPQLDIVSGYIIDYRGYKSEKFDYIIFEKDLAPIIYAEDNFRCFPCETVLAVGNFMLSLDNEKLNENLTSICELKKLERKCKDKKNIRHVGLDIGFGFSNGIEFNPAINFFDNIMCFIICKKIDINLSDLLVRLNTQKEFVKSIDYIYSFESYNIAKCSKDLSLRKIIYYSNNPNSYFPFVGDQCPLFYLLNDLIVFEKNARLQTFDVSDYLPVAKINLFNKNL